MDQDIYATFPDGWDFTPDVGNGKSRGEVFTPLYIVRRMIVQSGIAPETIVYDGDYDLLTTSELLSIVEKTVLEPAVGTGNFTSTILWYKLHAAIHCAESLKDLEKLFVVACSSVYFFDIDAGNVFSTLSRLLGKDSLSFLRDPRSHWEREIMSCLDEKTIEKHQNLPSLVSKSIELSLDTAVKHWGDKFSDSGVVQQVWSVAYNELKNDPRFVGIKNTISNHVLDACGRVLSSNGKVFDGITKEDAVSDNMVIPGYYRIFWSWWNIAYIDNVLTVSSEETSLFLQLRESELLELDKEIKQLTSDQTFSEDCESNMAPLIGQKASKMRWKDMASKKQYDKLAKRKKEILLELERFS